MSTQGAKRAATRNSGSAQFWLPQKAMLLSMTEILRWLRQKVRHHADQRQQHDDRDPGGARGRRAVGPRERAGRHAQMHRKQQQRGQLAERRVRKTGVEGHAGPWNAGGSVRLPQAGGSAEARAALRGMGAVRRTLH